MIIASATGPIPPSWTLESEATECTISQQYTVGVETRVIGVSQLIGGHDAKVVLVVPAASGADQGRGTLALSANDGGVSLTKPAEWFPAGPPGLRVLRFHLDAEEIEPLFLNGSFSATLDRGSKISFTPTAFADGLKQLRACQTKILAAAGIDTSRDADIVVPAKLKMEGKNYPSFDDYPVEAVRRGDQGTALALWKIDTTGNIEDCRVVQSSGSAALDQASCRAIKLHLRYKPALGADNQPLPSHDSLKITWLMPNGPQRVISADR